MRLKELLFQSTFPIWAQLSASTTQSGLLKTQLLIPCPGEPLRMFISTVAKLPPVRVLYRVSLALQQFMALRGMVGRFWVNMLTIRICMSSHKQVGGEKRERERHGKSATNVGGMDPCAHFKWLFTLVYIAQCALSFFFARSCVLSLLGLARARERKRPSRLM